MAGPSVTYTFSNSTTADATQVNQNFTDLINSMTDGTKSFSISALTLAGTATLNGSVSLGQSSANSISFNGSVATSIPVSANNSYDFGSSTLGMRSFYIGSAGGFTTRLLGSATASYTFTLPPTGGSAHQILRTDGSGTATWISPVKVTSPSTGNLSAGSATSSTPITNLSVTATFTGRDVLLLLQPDGSTSNISFFGVSHSGVESFAILTLKKDGTAIALYEIIAPTNDLRIPPGTVNFIDTNVSAGSHTYTLEYYVDGGTSTFFCRYIQLIAREIL